MPVQDPFRKRLLLATRVTVVAYFLLHLLFFAKTVLLPMGGREPNITMWAVHSLPLLLFLPGMLRGDHRSYAWLSFAILMYFIVTVEALFSPQASHYHSATLVLVIVLFTGCVLTIRWKGLQHQWHAADAEQKAES